MKQLPWLFSSVPLPGPQSYLGFNLQMFFLSSCVGPKHWKYSNPVVLNIPSTSILCISFPRLHLSFSFYKRTGYSGWLWKASGGSEQESGWGFSGLVSVVRVCCSVLVHAENVGHTRNYSGNLRRPVASILKIQSVSDSWQFYQQKFYFYVTCIQCELA